MEVEDTVSETTPAPGISKKQRKKLEKWKRIKEGRVQKRTRSEGPKVSVP